MVPVANGGRPRTVVLTPALIEALRVSHRENGEVLPFSSTSRLYRRLARLAELAGIEGGVSGRGVHALRHSSATRIYEQTGDLVQAGQHLGHASIGTMQRYVKGNLSRVAATLANWTQGGSMRLIVLWIVFVSLSGMFWPTHTPRVTPSGFEDVSGGIRLAIFIVASVLALVTELGIQALLTTRRNNDAVHRVTERLEKERREQTQEPGDDPS